MQKQSWRWDIHSLHSWHRIGFKRWGASLKYIYWNPNDLLGKQRSSKKEDCQHLILIWEINLSVVECSGCPPSSLWTSDMSMIFDAEIALILIIFGAPQRMRRIACWRALKLSKTDGQRTEESQCFMSFGSNLLFKGVQENIKYTQACEIWQSNRSSFWVPVNGCSFKELTCQI